MTITECAEKFAPIYAAEQWGWWPDRNPSEQNAAEIKKMILQLMRWVPPLTETYEGSASEGGLIVQRSGTGWRVTMASRSHGEIVCEVTE